jgi:hypothetical protein
MDRSTRAWHRQRGGGRPRRCAKGQSVLRRTTWCAHHESDLFMSG